MKKLLLITSILFFLGACDSSHELPSVSVSPSGGTYLGSPEKQNKLFEELKKQDINHWMYENDNTVFYKLVDLAKVRSIIQEIKTGGKLDPNYHESYTFVSKRAHEIFKSLMVNHNIPFDEFTPKYATKHISWSHIHGPKVDKLIQEAKIQSYKEFRNEAKSN